MAKSHVHRHRDNLIARVHIAIAGYHAGHDPVHRVGDEVVRLVKFGRALLDQRAAVRKRNAARRRGADGVE